MKKLFYVAAAALALCAASCGDSNDAQGKFFSEQASDSLVSSFGTAAGYALNQQIMTAMLADSTITKESFLRGLQYGMACDTTDDYMNGVITGLQIQTQLKRFHSMGIDVNPSVALDAFKEAFLSDTLPSQTELALADANYRRWADSLAVAQQRYQNEQMRKAVEAKAE